MRRLALCLVVAVLFVAVGCPGPSSSELRTRGISEFQVGHLDKAKTSFQQVLDRYPSDAESLYYIGRVNQAQGNYEQAIYYYQCALDAAPGFKEAAVWLDRARRESGADSQRLKIIP